MITAAGIRAAMARLGDSGDRPTIQNIARELHVKAVELEPLIHQMVRDGQLDPAVDMMHELDPPAGAGDSGSTRTPAAQELDASRSRAGGVSYLYIPAVDPKQSAMFYEHVFGWSVDGHETNRPSFRDGSGHVAGAWVTDQEPSPSAGLVPYISVETMDETTELIQAHGGEIIDAPSADGDHVTAAFRDPAGNVLGLRQEVTTPGTT
jgi:uncharacterized protein